MEEANVNLLVEGAKLFGIGLSEDSIYSFEVFLNELLRWNQKINLTAIRSEKEIVLKHFMDSFSVAPYIPGNSTLLDIGSGAGFPGIPLKIIRPNLLTTLIDSVRKKVDFQRHLIRLLDLKGIEAIHGHVGEQEIYQRLREKFDFTISRAFSDLKTLLNLSSPFLKKEGIVIAMKGRLNTEVTKLPLETEELPYRLKEKVSLILPFTAYHRTILFFAKLS